MEIKLRNFSSAAEHEIFRAESEIGARLPADYRSFLSKFNSAVPGCNMFRDDMGISVERFIPVSEIGARVHTIDGFPDASVPIAECSSGNFIYINLKEPGVFFWDHEVEGERKLADSFTDFLNHLREFDIDTIQLDPARVHSVWVDPDFKPEFD